MPRFPDASWRPLSVNFERGGCRPRMLVLHVMQGTLGGTDSWFRIPSTQASAHFGIGFGGEIYQWVDTADVAWHAADANDFSIGVENAGESGELLTAEQISANAAIAEWAHQVHGIPLELCDNVQGRGLAWHGLGGLAWGNHPECPGAPIVAQRPAIITAAKGGSNVSATGPEHWDAADWEALRRQMQRGVLAHVGNGYVTGLSAEEAADVEAAHEGLITLIGDATVAVSAGDIAQAIVAALPPAAAGGLTADQLQASVEGALGSFLGKLRVIAAAGTPAPAPVTTGP